MNKAAPDDAILEVASLFLTDEPALAGRANELAEYLQNVIEDWIEAENEEAAKAGKE